MSETLSLDAVYYSQQVPRSLSSLTFLGMVFDRVYFPGVYIPATGFDPEATIAEINRIKSEIQRPTHEDIQLLQCMGFALHKKHLEDFCVFTASPSDTFGRIEEKETPEIAARLEEMIYGPPPPGFTPSFASGYAKGMPGSDTEAIRYPGWLYYPANALVFAAKNNLPLINDNPLLPVPGLGATSPKDNAKVLATILTIESIKIVMPEIPDLTPEELAEFRSETREQIKPFRLAILKLSKQLNAQIKSDTDAAEIQRTARFIAETEIVPAMEDLRGIVLDRRKFWYKKAITFGTKAPHLIGAFFMLATGTAMGAAGAGAAGAIVSLLTALAQGLGEVRDEQVQSENMRRGQFYYLLEMQEKLKRP